MSVEHMNAGDRRRGMADIARTRLLILLVAVGVGLVSGCHGAEDGSRRPGPSGDVLPPLQGDARYLYVAPWGRDSNPGTFDEPVHTLDRLSSVARPGDVVVLRGGVYDVVGGHVYLSVSMSGAAGAPITIRSYPGEMAIFDGHKHPWHPRYLNDGRSGTDPELFAMVGDHLVWEDVTFRNGVGRGFVSVGNHNVLRRVVSHHQHASGVYVAGSYNLLEYVTAHSNDSVANGGNSGDGITMTDYNPASQHNIIRYSLAYLNSDDGIDVWNSRDVLLEHNVSFGNGIGPSGNGMGFKIGGDRLDSGVIARFNIAFDNVNNFDTNGSTGVLLYNNTAWAARSTNYVLTRHSTNACDNEAYNNISYQPGSYHVVAGSCTVHTHNSWNLGIVNPQFTSIGPNSPDFLSLSATSPAIDRGIDLGFAYTGSAPDLGALEQGEAHALAPLTDGQASLSWLRTVLASSN